MERLTARYTLSNREVTSKIANQEQSSYASSRRDYTDLSKPRGYGTARSINISKPTDSDDARQIPAFTYARQPPHIRFYYASGWMISSSLLTRTIFIQSRILYANVSR